MRVGKFKQLSTNLEINVVGAKLKINKVDSETKQNIPIKGIKFKIKNLDTGEYLKYKNKDIYETDENGVIITPFTLDYGNYELEEIDQVINGYLWNKETYKFKIDENTTYINDKEQGLIFEINFENKKVKGCVEIIKKGENDLKYLENKYNLDIFEVKTILKSELNVDNNYLIIHDSENVSKEVVKKIEDDCNRIIEGTPLQYVTGHQEFYGLDFLVNENVLIPQPDTEILVENALNYCKDKNDLKVLDLCTGSGAIAISLKSELKDKAVVYASDISKNALEVAKKNAARILKDEKINFIESNMFESINEKFDVIVSNPPYIKTNVIEELDKDVQNEPFIALDGGEDGLDFYRIICENCRKFLNKQGILMMEIGYDQGKEVQALLENSKVIKDLAGIDRVIFAHI